MLFWFQILEVAMLCTRPHNSCQSNHSTDMLCCQLALLFYRSQHLISGCCRYRMKAGYIQLDKLKWSNHCQRQHPWWTLEKPQFVSFNFVMLSRSKRVEIPSSDILAKGYLKVSGKCVWLIRMASYSFGYRETGSESREQLRASEIRT